GDPSGSKFGNASLANGNGTIATSYTYSACGLDFTYHSAALHKRSFTFGVSPINQPYSFPITGIPPCAIIEKAFVYANFERASTLTSVNLSLTNPASTNSIFPMTLIGTGQSVCWGGGATGSKTFRADVTALISGNGNYIISGLPVGASGPDCNGFTMFVIWSNPTQNWTGHFVIADGSYPVLGGTANANITGFNVCGPTNSIRNFMCIGDLQKIVNTPLNFNSATSNGVLASATQSVWNYVEANVAAPTTGQTNAQFVVGPNSSDCFNLCVAGMYFRTTCSVCPVASSPLTVSVASTPSCPTANATVVSVSGGPGPYSYTWTPSAQNTSVATNLTSGTYTVTVMDATGCKTGSATINVVTSPPNTITVNSATLCQGQSANLSASGAPSLTWSPATGLSSTVGANVVANPNSTTIYTVSYTNSLGCTSTATSQVVVNPTPVISVSGSTVCANQTVSLTVTSTPVANYTWTGPGGFTSNLSNPQIVNAQPSASGIYSVFVQTAQGCTNEANNVPVTVHALPVPSVNANSPLCQNQNLQFSSSGGNAYSWSGPNGYTSNQQNPSIANAQPNMSGTYTLVVTGVGSCTNSTTINITVNPLPNVTAANNGTACELGTTGISATGANTYTWYGPNNFTSNQANITFSSVLSVQSGTYIVIGTDANGCQNTAQTVLNIYPNPAVIVSGATVCSGNNATLSCNSNGVAYQWSGPNGFTANTPIIIINNVGQNQVGTYTVTAISNMGCTTSNMAILDIYPNPTIAASFNTPTVCLGGTVYAKGEGGYQYSWYGANGLVVSSDEAFTFTASSLAYNSTYTLGIIGAPYGCKNSTVIALTVYDLPKAKLVADDKMCVPFCTTLNLLPELNSAPIQNAYWTVNNSIGLTGTSVPYCMNTAGSLPIRVHIEDIRGCKNTQNLSLTGYPRPKADFYWSPLIPKEQTDDVTFKDASMGENLVKWTWFIQNNQTQQMVSGNPVVVNYEKAGNYAVMMVVENVWGCKDSIIKPIRIDEDVVYYVPDAFSPNGDGINDTFGPKGYGPFTFELTIHDRWGEKIFTSRKLNEPWDGTFRGEECKPDIYVWKLTVTLPGGKKEIKTGHVTLLK
ncbi:MAG: gliding motility-associated C-terminal domain-containing protein, partial [Bacteroidia bacterium]|nr:gliding motility-associated C-terminal domain-containing protein [Bacteroidia bacterium]